MKLLERVLLCLPLLSLLIAPLLWSAPEARGAGAATQGVDLTLSGSEDRNAFIADATLGLNYGFDMGLNLRLGYRVSIWTNMPVVRLIEDEAGNFIDDTDSSLGGVFVGAGWTF